MKKGILCILTCMLMISSMVLPISSQTTSNTRSQSLTMGSILYVGGIGPNNYTKIQDAIDNTTNGDTVFVFNDSSPYLENLVILTSISLIGEEKTTTIIDGGNKGNGVNITADTVTVRGFTIQQCNGSGIYLRSNYSNITDNIFSDTWGITDTNRENITFPLSQGHNTITNNLLIDNGGGIYLVNEENSIISHNTISHTVFGITLIGSSTNNISFNKISNGIDVGVGIYLMVCSNTTVYRNNISYNGLGIWTFITSADKILQNTFIGNNRSALTYQGYLSRIKIFNHNSLLPIKRNIWNGNYWEKPRTLPIIIPGVFLKLSLQIDWHPAQEPYII